jgi:iron complex outermembrane recepter protein
MPKSNRSSSLMLRHAVSLCLAVGAGFFVSQAAFAQDPEPEKETKETKESEENVATLSDVNVTEDTLRALSNEPSASSFGFAKPLLETPRTVTFVSEEQLRLYGVSTVEDLSRLVPGTYTTTRYGLQGGISVRGVSADFYYRGMRRLQMQGHVRTVLSAYDNIEVIKGPPSPLYGMGQIGGYANLDPKSNRAKTGKYMTESNGYFQATHDEYGKNETQFGLGVPFTIAEKPSGVYFVGLLEDSKTYIKTVPAKQKFLQTTLSMDNAIGPFRLEMGGQVQNSVTAGAYFARVTQDLIDDGTYITGRPLAELDLNRDGRVGYVESYLASPVTGTISGNNQALDQRFTLRVDASGNPLPIASFANSIVGIPQTLKTYLTTGPGSSLNCPLANYMRDVAPVMTLGTATTGSLVTRNLPIGFALNPCTTGTVKLAKDLYRANGAYEREQNADQLMGYMDLIYDTNPNFTIKNQIFYDSIDSFKDSWLPYGENQAIETIEDKITATARVPTEWLPRWLSINALGSVNYRETSGFLRSSGGDWDYRQDITYTTGAGGSGTGGFYSNTMFWTQLTNADYQTGAVNTTWRRSRYSEQGIGLMFDINLGQKTNLLVGARSDKVEALVNESASFNPNTGNIGTPTQAFLDAYAAGLVCTTPGGPCPGANLAGTADVTDTDRGQSYSASLSHELPWGRMRPYVTVARSTITLDGSNNLYARGTLLGGKIIGEAELQEFGIKGELFRGRVQWTLSGFQQDRTDVSNPSDPSIGAFATSTTTEGLEASINAQATKNLFIGASVTLLEPRYTTGLTTGQTIDVSARDLGFQDIVLPNGDIYPAEAFGYGGRLRVLVNDPNNIYDEVPGSPEMQLAMNATYTIGKGFGVLLNAQHFSKSWANRLQTVELPATTLANIGVTWDYKRIHLKGNLYNVTDELQFRATSGGNPNMLSVLPDRRYELSMKIDF